MRMDALSVDVTVRHKRRANPLRERGVPARHPTVAPASQDHHRRFTRRRPAELACRLGVLPYLPAAEPIAADALEAAVSR